LLVSNAQDEDKSHFIHIRKLRVRECLVTDKEFRYTYDLQDKEYESNRHCC